MFHKKNQNRRVEEFGTEFKDKVLYVNRCSKVVKGGRKFSFSALVVVGDRQGHLGVGFAKANEVADAIRKATDLAKRSVFEIAMEGDTIPHEIVQKLDGARVLLRPAPKGHGAIASPKIRTVLELGGIKDVVAKNLGSTNPQNQVMATVHALAGLHTRETIMALRGISC